MRRCGAARNRRRGPAAVAAGGRFDPGTVFLSESANDSRRQYAVCGLLSLGALEVALLITGNLRWGFGDLPAAVP